MTNAPRATAVWLVAAATLVAIAGFLAGRFTTPVAPAAPPIADRRVESADRAQNGAPPPAPAERTETPAGDNAAAEVARLNAQIIALETEIVRLRALADARDPRRRRLDELVAANDLKYGEIDAEIAELLLLDGESVADDPRPLFALLVRLVDETGLALAPPESDSDHERTLEPEPNAPGVRLILGLQSVDLVDTIAGSSGKYTQETVGLRILLKLPKTPDEWKGGPLDLELHLLVESDSRGEVGANFTAAGRSFAGKSDVSWRGLWFREKSSLHRSPRNGGAESLDGAAGDFALERRIVEDLFEKLKSRAR